MPVPLVGAMAVRHIGFDAAVERVMKEGYSKEQAERIVASRTRHASAQAKRENPRLRRVKG
jgi:hypothetical protein